MSDQISEKTYKTFVETLFERYYVNAKSIDDQEVATKPNDSLFYVRYVPGRKRISGNFIHLIISPSKILLYKNQG